MKQDRDGEIFEHTRADGKENSFDSTEMAFAICCPFPLMETVTHTALPFKSHGQEVSSNSWVLISVPNLLKHRASSQTTEKTTRSGGATSQTWSRQEEAEAIGMRKWQNPSCLVLVLRISGVSHRNLKWHAQGGRINRSFSVPVYLS